MRATIRRCALFVLAVTACAAETNAPNDRDARVSAWRDARFGLFIHWGPYAGLPDGQASSPRGLTMPDKDYDLLYQKFNPVKFDADAWVNTAKAAGMKYIVFTTMHADGFCMWDTKETDYNIMHTPFRRDVVRELSDACRKQGLGFGAYYSILNWYHPLSMVAGRRFDIADGKKTLVNIPNPKGDIPAYAEHVKRQLTELVTQYGPFTTLWADVPYHAITREEGNALVKHTLALQPDILINNRFFGYPYDYVTPEQKLGAFDNKRPWESCMVMGECWSRTPNEQVKSARHCLQLLLACAGGDGNLLLDVGPDETGVIDPREVANLTAVGAWMARHGDSIYRTRGGPFMPWKLGVSTHRENTVYLHLMHWIGDTVRLPPLPARIVKSSVLTGGQATVDQTEGGIAVSVPAADRDPWDTVVALELDRPAATLPPVAVKDDESLRSLARGKAATSSMGKWGKPERAFDGDEESIWSGNASSNKWLAVDLGAPTRFDCARIVESGVNRTQTFQLEYLAGQDWKTFHHGTSIDGTVVLHFAPVTAQQVRLLIQEASAPPRIAEWELFATVKFANETSVVAP